MATASNSSSSADALVPGPFRFAAPEAREESADLLFHLLVALEQRGVRPGQVLDVLRKRRSGA